MPTDMRSNTVVPLDIPTKDISILIGMMTCHVCKKSSQWFTEAFVTFDDKDSGVRCGATVWCGNWHLCTTVSKSTEFCQLCRTEVKVHYQIFLGVLIDLIVEPSTENTFCAEKNEEKYRKRKRDWETKYCVAYHFKNTYSPITLANISSINLVSVFRYSSSTTNPV
jgi:hypothetical protein